MAFLCSLICILLAYASYSNDFRFYSPRVLFSLFWAIITFFSGLRLYGLFESSFFAYVVVTLGVCCFYFGSVLCNKCFARNVICYSELHVKRFWLLSALCLLGILLNVQFVLDFILRGMSISQIYSIMAQTVSGEETQFSAIYSNSLARLQQYVGYPLLYTLVPIAISEYIESKKKKFLYITLLFSLLRFLYDVRRTYLVIFILYIIFYLIISKNININFMNILYRYKKQLFFLFITLILFAVLSSSRRSSSDNSYSFWYNLYTYYAGSLPYFSERLRLLHNFDFTYGFTSLRGLFAPFFAIGGLLGIDEPELMSEATHNIESLHNTVLNVTPTHKFNSYATCFFQFYQDGGILGVMLISFMFGYYSQYLFEKCIVFNSKRYQMLFAYFLSLFIFLSVLHFNGVVVCYIWPFILERFLYRQERVFI